MKNIAAKSNLYFGFAILLILSLGVPKNYYLFLISVMETSFWSLAKAISYPQVQPTPLPFPAPLPFNFEN